jgi:hypothetical protein
MKNLVEEAVRDTHAELLRRNAGYCPCSQCADDVVTYVLNQLRPRYTNTAKGWALANLELRSDQGRADLAVRVLEAMNRVAQSPRHPPLPGTRNSG